MPLFHFTLLLKGVTSETPELEHHLYASGCDDALVCFYGRAVYLEFDRQSDSFANAIMSAVRAIESSPLAATVTAVDASLVGLSDIAQLSKLTRQSIAMLKDGSRGAGDFPSPVQRINGNSPLWSWACVAAWLQRHGKIAAPLAENARTLEEINLALQLRNADGQQVQHFCRALTPDHAD
ncbi:hypothetical protein [Erwinia pyrifoliae]|uniref:hypothetical protein n=1 Tax=Erwinia pyrifoliae TaxID=79967 RepID=UPI00019614C5|nr:hypothetical protein [Erwinia pyrifoliae]AUX71398.1 DNA-binding protein [Erwinia pyrifoliae]MCA8874872.1 DNA-binding protein [Erwinia pyrifoliae]UWS28982.1 DNA-binding protein [Erwinia pyrifoliae]CAX57048.1 Putative phage transcriptional regulator [Erwinia pyrifoliae Ep1/96]